MEISVFLFIQPLLLHLQIFSCTKRMYFRDMIQVTCHFEEVTSRLNNRKHSQVQKILTNV